MLSRYAIFFAVAIFAANFVFGQSMIESLGTMEASRNMEKDSLASPTGSAEPPRSEPEYSPSSPSGSGSGANAVKNEVKSFGDKSLSNGWWGGGGYISIIKLLSYMFLFLFWIFVADWVNCDTERQKDAGYATWNLLFLLIFPVPFFLVFHLAPFIVGFPILALCFFVPSIVYVVHRNKNLPPFERVLTPDHIVYLFAVALGKIGIKVRLKKKMSYEHGPALELDATGKGIDDTILKGRTILARNHPGFNDLRKVLHQGLLRGADGVMLDLTPTGMQPKFQIDGVWHDLQPMNNDTADALIESAKLLAGGDPHENKKRQNGSFSAVLDRSLKFDTDFIVQGTITGERALFQFVIKKIPFNKLDELGMRAETQKRVTELVNMPTGFVVFSSAPANGLKSTMNIVSRTADRFTRDFSTVEDEMDPYQTIENITKVKYNSSRGETPMNVLPDVFFREPHVLLIRNMVNLESLELCCNEIEENRRLIITTIRARDAAESLLRVLSYKIDPKLFAANASASISQRLIRKLCPDCKEEMQASPQLLQKLGISPNSETTLFKTRSAPVEGEKRKPCLTCNDIGYKGRTALFEIVEINDDIRQVLVSKPSIEAIRQAVFNSGQKGFFHEGALLVAQGVTSVEELSRVMKM